MNARLSIVLMQKDEGELLRAWINHHLEITTPELIYIFDNGSTCLKTQKILKIAKKRASIFRFNITVAKTLNERETS